MGRRPGRLGGAVLLLAGWAATAAGSDPISVSQVLPPAVVQGQGFSADVYVTNAAQYAVEDVRLVGSWSPGYRLTAAVPPQAPGGDGKTTWSLGRLSPGEQRQVKLTFAPTDQAPGPEFRSEFEASFRGAKASVQSVPVRQPSLDLLVTGPAVAVVGQKVQVHVTLKNPGQVQVSGVKLSSKLPDGLSHPGGTDLEADVPVMQAGHTEAVPLDLTPTKAGPVRAVFRVAGPGLQPIEREVNLVAIDARLEIDVTGPRTLPLSWPGTYELTVRNAGTGPAPEVQLEVAVPAGFDDQNLRATEGAKYDPAGRKLVWNVGELPPNGSKSMIWLGVAGRPGEATAAVTAKVRGVTAKAAEWRTVVQPK